MYHWLLMILITGCMSGCVPRHVKYSNPEMTIIKATLPYTIGQHTETQFLIFAGNSATARDAADKELDCKKRVCQITQTGIILFVERPLQ